MFTVMKMNELTGGSGKINVGKIDPIRIPTNTYYNPLAKFGAEFMCAIAINFSVFTTWCQFTRIRC